MKILINFKIILIIQILLISQYSLSQQKVRPNFKMLNLLGKDPYKTESNCVSENLIHSLYFVPQSTSNLKIGFMNTNGKVIIKPTYDMASDFYNGYANIIKDATYGYIDKKGQEVFFKNYESTYFYYNDTGIAQKNGKYALINRKGEPLTEFKYNMILFFGFNHFRGLISKNMGHILDSEGKIIFNENLEYDIKSDYFKKDSLLVYEKKIDNKDLQGILTINNIVITEPVYEKISFIKNQDFLVIQKDQKFGLINKNGQEIIPPIYDGIGSTINENLIPVKQKDKWGFISKENKVIIPFEFDDVNPFFEEVAFTKKESFFGGIDKNNKIKIPFNLENSNFLMYTDGLCVFKKDEKYGYIDKTGKVVIPAIYDFAYPFVNKLAYVEKNNKAGYINTKGKEIIPIQYSQLWSDSENLIRFVE